MRLANTSCAICRFMRSFAFTGLGMGIGSGAAYLWGATQENILMSGMFVAFIIVFGLMDKKRKR